MSNKITEATLVALEYQDAMTHGLQLSPFAEKWIKKHGVPDTRSTYLDQRREAGFDKPPKQQEEKPKDDEPTIPEIDSSAYERLKCAYGQFGAQSREVDDAIFQAREDEVPFKTIQRCVHKGYAWVKIRVDRSKDYQDYQKLRLREKSLFTDNMRTFLQHEYRKGISDKEIAKWTDLPLTQVRQILKSAASRYIALITYHVAFPLESTPEQRYFMLTKSKPKLKLNTASIRSRITQYFRDNHMPARFKLKINTVYDFNNSVEMKIEPISELESKDNESENKK